MKLILTFDPSPNILKSLTDIAEIIGQFKARNIVDIDPKLRKINQIKSITSTCAIEGNTLGESRVTDIINEKPVVGHPREILEIKNALALYETKKKFDYQKMDHLLKAHQILMKGLIEEAGVFRKTGVGITDGKKLIYRAPDSPQVLPMMKSLFEWIGQNNEYDLILQSAFFHCEFETIHPFSDGNGRMGRFWQHLMLIEHHPIFRFTPVETIVHNHQMDYYKALQHSQKNNDATSFMEFSLFTIYEALNLVRIEIGNYQKNSSEDRIKAFVDAFKGVEFTRKNYIVHYKGLAGLSASRDIALGVKLGILTKTGEKRLAKYKIIR